MVVTKVEGTVIHELAGTSALSKLDRLEVAVVPAAVRSGDQKFWCRTQQMTQ
jgi:hypothetical protein